MSSKSIRTGGSDEVDCGEKRVKSMIWLMSGLRKYVDMQNEIIESARSAGISRFGVKYKPGMGGAVSSAGLFVVTVARDEVSKPLRVRDIAENSDEGDSVVDDRVAEAVDVGIVGGISMRRCFLGWVIRSSRVNFLLLLTATVDVLIGSIGATCDRLPSQKPVFLYHVIVSVYSAGY